MTPAVEKLGPIAGYAAKCPVRHEDRRDVRQRSMSYVVGWMAAFGALRKFRVCVVEVCSAPDADLRVLASYPRVRPGPDIHGGELG